MLVAADSAVRAFVDAIGVGIKNEAALEERTDDVDERVVHDAVAKGGGADHARFRLVNFKRRIVAGLISLRLQFFLQAPKIFFETVKEIHDIKLLALAGRRLLRRQQEVFKREDLGEEFFVGLHNQFNL